MTKRKLIKNVPIDDIIKLWEEGINIEEELGFSLPSIRNRLKSFGLVYENDITIPTYEDLLDKSKEYKTLEELSDHYSIRYDVLLSLLEYHEIDYFIPEYSEREYLKNYIKNMKKYDSGRNINHLLKNYAKSGPEAKYIIMNDLEPFYKHPCKRCGKPTRFHGDGYAQHCSPKCSGHVGGQSHAKNYNIETYKKGVATRQERYGKEVISPLSVPGAREKYSETAMKKYNAEHPMHNDNVKNKIVETNMERYGIEYSFQREDVKENIKNTMLERYGVEYPTQSETVKQKVIMSNLEKFGVENPFQSEEIKDKIKQINLERYGYEYATQSETVKQKAIKTSLEKYGVEYYGQSEEHRSKIRMIYDSDEYFMKHLGFTDPTPYLNGDSTWSIGLNNGFSPYIFRRLLKVKNIEYDEPANGSSYEDGMAEFLDELGVEYERNTKKIITPYELDFYIPEHNIAIEMNGVYWHSLDTQSRLDKNYHQMKFNRCKDLGITLIQITDIEWNNDSDKWKNLIRSKLVESKRLFARKTKCVMLNNQQAQNFTDLYHIQGHRTAKHYLGLIHNYETVALASFSKHKVYDWELIRFCSKDNVVGGFSKLLSHFRRQNPGSIFSYSNSNFSIGDVYSKNGFEYLGQTVPSYYWTDGNEVRTRQSVQKWKLGYTETEVEYMTKQGYYRYFDAGNERWVLK